MVSTFNFGEPMRHCYLIVSILFSTFASAQSYETVVVQINQTRQNFVQSFQEEKKPPNQDKVQELVYTTIYEKIIPFWYGTPWSFSGHTIKPKDGTIACGYFVSTVLQHAGFKVERVRLAQQASEHIILSLVKDKHVKRFRNYSFEKFVDTIKTWGKGIYIVGLDNHVGFLVHDGNKVYFIHSSYVFPSRVVREIAGYSPVLAWSRYRVVGKLTADNELMNKWLNQIPIKTMLGSG